VALSPSAVAKILQVRVIDVDRLQANLRFCARYFPQETQKAMGRVTMQWAGRAAKYAPIRATRRKGEPGVRRWGETLYPPFYNKGPRGGTGTGRGQLRAGTKGKVIAKRGVIVGMVYNYVPYASYIEFGTQDIAGGKVLRWTPGSPAIKKWKWRIPGKTNPRGQMPFIRSQLPMARDQLVKVYDRLLRKVTS